MLSSRPQTGAARPPITADDGSVTVDLRTVIESAQSLEPLPASVARLAALVSDDDADLREIVEVISFDQALTGNLLRRANSAASAGRNPIRTVHEAVVRLGTGTVLALAMSSAVAKRMHKAIPEYGLTEGDLWKHSVASSLAAEVVRTAAKTPVPPEIGTAALLHDIGKLVLCRFLGPSILHLLDVAREVEGYSRLEAESVVLQVNHGELGGLVAQHWRLPESIVIAISYHHQPAACDQPIAHAAYLANVLAHEVDETPDDDVVTDESRVASMRELGIDEAKWPSLLETLTRRYEDLAARYS